MARILVTGGAGYIGSHTCVELLNQGDEVVVVDDLCNSSAASLDAVRNITGRDLTFIEADLADRSAIAPAFAEPIDAVIHFAGLKAVGESVEQPLRYWRTNLDSTFTLLEAMADNGVDTIVFSSSATVYGDPERVPIPETAKVGATNPYGATKLTIEWILSDAAVADPSLKAGLLRYFNPVGAHESGQIGEDPRGIPNNLMPYIMQVAVGRRDRLAVYGNDYDTPDGTGVRDYIHVVDLARGHLAALDHLAESQPGSRVWNLGSGRGHSVLEMVAAVEAATGKPLPYEVVDRREGDVAVVVADPTRANEELGWSAELGLKRMCADSWRWQSTNPEGFTS